MSIKQDLSTQVLQKIKAEKIAPQPRWTFALKNYLIWFFSIIFILTGGLAIAVSIFLLRHNDWDIYEQLTDSLLKFVLLTLPYFWLGLLVIFLLIVHWSFRQTKRGYKYSGYFVVVTSLVLSILLGSVLYALGAGARIDHLFTQKLPFYSRFIQRRTALWSAPERGRIGGVIVEVSDLQHFKIRDFREHIWKIEGSDPIFIPGPEIIVMENRVRILGAQKDAQTIEPFMVLPFELKGDFWRNRDRIREYLLKHPEILKRMRGGMRFGPSVPPPGPRPPLFERNF